MKLEKYNQRLLAVLGTAGVIFLIVALIAFITVAIIEIRQSMGKNVETGILSDEKIEELQKENKREQVISYETPRLIDTLNSVYIIPVSHKTLNEQEEIDRPLNLLSSSNSYEPGDSRYSSIYYGTFNNLIIYDPKKDTTKKLFGHRVNFRQIDVEYFKDDILLLMPVSEKDTYKDGVINLMDFKTLYVYSLANKALKKVGVEGMDMYSYKILNEGKDLAIRFGVDKNEDGQYQEHNEPTLIKKYDFEKDKLIEIVDEKTNSDLQKSLEGTKQ